jgi:hypothetical protein
LPGKGGRSAKAWTGGDRAWSECGMFAIYVDNNLGGQRILERCERMLMQERAADGAIVGKRGSFG